MSRRSLKVPNKHLIFKDLSLRGLWVTRWLEHADHADIYAVLHPLALMIMDGRLHTAVDAVVPMREFKQAIARAQESGRAGKVILDFTNV
jgi:trans-2-enoyl-CoA reductase